MNESDHPVSKSMSIFTTGSLISLKTEPGYGSASESGSKSLYQETKTSSVDQISCEDRPRKIPCFSSSAKALAILNEPYFMEDDTEIPENTLNQDKKVDFHDLFGQNDKNKIMEILIPGKSVDYSKSVKIREKTEPKQDLHLKEVKKAVDFDFLDGVLDNEDVGYYVEMFSERSEDVYSKGLSLRPEDNKSFSENDFDRFINNPFGDSYSSDEFDTIILGDSMKSDGIFTHNMMNIPNVTMDIGYLDDDNKSTCIICTKSFVKKSDFTLHIKMHVMLPYQCKSCDECCLTAELMDDHIAVAHPMIEQGVIIKEMLGENKNGMGKLENEMENKTLDGERLKNKMLEEHLSGEASEREKLRKAKLQQRVLTEVIKVGKDKFKQRKMKHKSHKKEKSGHEMVTNENIAHEKIDPIILGRNVRKKLTMEKRVVRKGDERDGKVTENTVKKEVIGKRGLKKEAKQEEGLEEKLRRESKKEELKKAGERGEKLKNEKDKKMQRKRGTQNKKTSEEERNGKIVTDETVKKKSVKKNPNKKEVSSKRKPSERSLTRKKPIKTKQKTYKCDICKKKYKKNRNLKIHKSNNHNDKPNFICEHCKKIFKLHSFYEHHLKCHSKPRNFVCATCDATYTCKSHLARHLIKHTGLRSFHCHVCSKTYTRNDQLTVHLRTHSDVAPYVCSQCNKRFNRSDQFQLHLRRHDGVKPFQCAGCKFAFCQKSDMNRHVKKCQKIQKK